MDPNNNAHLFLKLIEDYDPVFLLLADKFWRDFYDKNFKGGEATLYVGDRYWNVKMEGWSDESAFTDGLFKPIEDLVLDSLLCCLQVLDIKLLRCLFLIMKQVLKFISRRLKLLFWMILFMEMKDLIY
ncbi:hypothetical protein HanOQP8_Chr17g0674571 [Helianthus annuus]|nr:hypothetical protein HanLR1_Chr17g0679581 [Helianthus annuus]KAJ0637493.1 hypothetical protein HanOQP8_Chr17g0674571 [Helianthus annuus]